MVHQTIDIVMSLVQVICLVLSIYYYKFYKNSTEKHFVFFLSYVIITEILGYVLVYNPNYSVQVVYNIFTIISFSFYLYWFSLILNKSSYIQVCALIFLISIVFQIVIDSSVNILWKIPLTTGTVILIVSSTLFYLKLLNSSEVINYFKSQKFWIVTGLLIFYVGFLPIQILQESINGLSIDYYLIIMLLNIFMYGSFSVGFIQLKK